jgi:hypothetical protein
MKKKPNIDAFIEGGAADKGPQTKPEPAAMVAKVQREQKMFRLSVPLINGLKRLATEQSIATGNRVTETELVEHALQEFLSKHKAI